MRTKIEVTWNDIRQGVRGKSCGCPIFIAIKRVRDDVAYVGTMHAKFGVKCDAFLPVDAVCFIETFDNGFRVSPFTFELDIPE